ncbi:MAG: serine hydrolase domain-containing protein [Flavisolibacter sp.]
MRLTDHTKLPSVVIEKGNDVFHFHKSSSLPQYQFITDYLNSQLPNSRTAAFLVIRNDSILYEKYFNGFDQQSILPSNSMAKSFTGTLVSIAVDEGAIKSTSEPLTNYLPELLKNDKNFSKITIQHLLDMRSGLDVNEGSYDLKDDAIRNGLRPNLRKHLLKIKIAEPPGRFSYQSANTQLLAMVIEKATGKKLFEYLEEKIWKPLGMEKNATWNVDSKKRKFALGSAGLNAITVDFAKLGRLYLNNGKWNEKQVLDPSWVSVVSHQDSMEKYGGYKNQWWNRPAYHTFSDSLTAVVFRDAIPQHSTIRKVQERYRVSYRAAYFGAIGFMNQLMYIQPEKKIIIIRLGVRWSHPDMNAIQFIHNLAEKL